jgi:hypothetical protein
MPRGLRNYDVEIKTPLNYFNSLKPSGYYMYHQVLTFDNTGKVRLNVINRCIRVTIVAEEKQ